MNEFIEKLEKATAELQSAKNRNSGIAAAKDKIKNILYNHMTDIVSAIKESDELKKEVRSLEDALDDADRENDELQKKIASLEAKPKKNSSKNTETA